MTAEIQGSASVASDGGVAIVDADVTSTDEKTQTYPAYLAIQMALMNQVSTDNKLQSIDVEKMKGQIDAKYIAEAINGKKDIGELNDLLDAFKQLGIDSPGLNSARDTIKEQYEIFKTQQKKAKDEAGKAGLSWNDAGYIAIGLAAGGILGAIGVGIYTAVTKNNHANAAENANNKATAANDAITKRLSHLKSGLGDGSVGLDSNKAALGDAGNNTSSIINSGIYQGV